MINFKFDTTNFWLLRPTKSDVVGLIFKGSWSGMRWIVLGSNLPHSYVESVKKLYIDNSPSSAWPVEINGNSTEQDLLLNGCSLSQLQAIWSICSALCDSGVCSDRLLELTNDSDHHPFATYIYPEMEKVQQLVYKKFLADASNRLLSHAEQSVKIQAQVEELKASVRVQPVDYVCELFVLTLKHIHWLVVNRFESLVNFEHDVGIASIWLNPSEWAGDGKRLIIPVLSA